MDGGMARSGSLAGGPPTAVHRLQQTVVDQHRQHLLDEQRIASGCPRDPVCVWHPAVRPRPSRFSTTVPAWDSDRPLERDPRRCTPTVPSRAASRGGHDARWPAPGRHRRGCRSGARAGRGTSVPPSGCRRSRRTTGRSVARTSRNRRAPQNSSVSGSCWLESPMAEASRSTISGSPTRAWSLSSASWAGMSMSMPAASRTISPSGQKVMPSPYDRARPRSTRASSPRDAMNSRISRDLPTPASPRSVTA